jgi:hypothetical protein
MDLAAAVTIEVDDHSIGVPQVNAVDASTRGTLCGEDGARSSLHSIHSTNHGKIGGSALAAKRLAQVGLVRRKGVIGSIAHNAAGTDDVAAVAPHIDAESFKTADAIT